MKKLVRRMAAARIEFVVPALRGGGLMLDAEDVENYVADPVGWYARRNRMSRKEVQAVQAEEWGDD